MKKRQVLAFLLILVLTAGTFAGCSSRQSIPEPESTIATTTTVAPAPTTEPVVSAEREITDMAGRTMTVPDDIGMIFSTNAISAIFLYTLAPDKLLGWNYELNDIERSMIVEEYHSLPNFGQGDAINYEAVIAAAPTIALNVSAINDGTIDQANELAEKLGAPVVMVSNQLKDAPETYRFLGELLGLEDQAELLAAYTEKTFDDISNMNIPEEEKIHIYYGNGEDSLETAPKGSSHGQIIDMVNAINIADLEMGDGSRVRISLEQLLAWDPDVIVVNGEPKSNTSGGAAADAIMNNPDFASLKAVQNGMVFGAPNVPFSWVDRPPGPNRIVGMRWLSALIYPDYVNYNVDEEVREFFRLFYHITLTDEKLEEIYNGINN